VVAHSVALLGLSEGNSRRQLPCLRGRRRPWKQGQYAGGSRWTTPRRGPRQRRPPEQSQVV